MKKILPDLIVILAYIAISFFYFFPAITEDRVIFQHDTVAGVGGSHEIQQYYEETGERSRWTNSMFSGMPTYQISPTYDSTRPLKFIEEVYHLFLPTYMWLVFTMMLGFYILLRAFGVSAWLSAIGGIAWGFSSYFFILIPAGHLWKFITLTYIPPTIAGVVLVYRKKYLLGAIVTALFMALQIISNHIQMTYYFLFVILFMVIAYFVDAYRKKELPHFFKASFILLAAALIGVSTNISTLYHTYDYSKETIRGGSELTLNASAGNAESGSGLDRDYITAWSYGIGETFTLLIPNVKGGASVPLGANETAMEKANPMYRQLYNQLPQYWGDQPGTAGPVYVGAFILMLFIFGLFIVKGPIKWALLAATILSIFLAWGRNFMGFTDFFIDYIPMYNKFRAVTSILVIAEFTIPLLAILALKEIFDKPRILIEKIKYVYISFALTGGIALLFAILPRLFFSSFIPAGEMAQLNQLGLPASQLNSIISNLEEVRVHLFTSDAWRSFFIIAIGTALLLIYRYKNQYSKWIVAGIAILCIVDLWSVDKRYLNDSNFVPRSTTTNTFRKTQADEYILQDQSLNYRVLNLSTNTFNENNTSYWHKSIGGYHAAKLQRYQDMIDIHISREMQNVFSEVANSGGDMQQVNPEQFKVLNMLNTKYMIFPTSESVVPILNPYAYGNAWFVDNVRYVNNTDEEITALNTIDPTETAVVASEFSDVLGGVTALNRDSLSSINLTSYAPNHLVYESSSSTGGVGVFSEIYYPRGWKVSIDGEPVEMGRANYVLRVLNIPAGKHVIDMRFDPTSLKITETIAYIGIGLLLLGMILYIVILIRRYRANPKVSD